MAPRICEDITFTLSIVYCTSRQKIADIRVDRIFRYGENDTLIEYSEQEKNTLVVYEEDSIEFKGRSDIRKRYEFPTSQVTMKRLIEAIIDFEFIDRPKYEWDGGIDCHHIFFEGIFATDDGAYWICWGS